MNNHFKAIGIALIMFCLNITYAQIYADFAYVINCDNSVNFTSDSYGGTTIDWDFGDQTTSQLTNPIHYYANPGAYTVSFTVSDGNISTTKQAVITISAQPDAQITGVANICENGTTTYTSAITGTGWQYSWTVIGGTLLPPQGSSTIDIKWGSQGQGAVELVVMNSQGCKDTSSIAVTIHPFPMPYILSPPDSFYTQSLTACSYDIINYVMQSYDPNSPNTLNWTITGGTITTGQGTEEITVEWGAPGIGVLTVTETSPFGCENSASINVRLYESPVANFTANDACLGQAVTFSNQSTGNINSYFWDFGDGNTSSQENPNHIYTIAGTYTVTLTVITASQNIYYSSGCSNQFQQTVIINQLPGPEIICPGTVCAGDAETYTTADVSGATYTWLVTGGTITGGGGINDTYIIVDWGAGPEGTISLTLNAPGYCPMASIITIPIVPNTVIIDGDQTVCTGITYFYNTPLFPGAIYTWTITEGIIRSGQGSNEVSVTWSAQPQGDISVNIYHPILDCGTDATLPVNKIQKFQLSGLTYVCLNDNETYNVTSTGPPTSGSTWNWTVIGGNIVSGQGTNSISVDWTTATSGQVIVENSSNAYCNNIDELSIYIRPLTPAIIFEGPDKVCELSTTNYYFESGYSYTYTVVGGTITSTPIWGPTLTIDWGTTGSGSITVQKINVCPISETYAIDILPNGPTSISGPTDICANEIATYTAVNGSGNELIWEIEGGTIIQGIGTNQIDVEWGDGPFGVLYVTNPICFTTQSLVIYIHKSNPPIIATDNLDCFGNSATLAVAGTYQSYLWNTGAITQNITITQPGSYAVTVTDIYGCPSIRVIVLLDIPSLLKPNAYVECDFVTPVPRPTIRLRAFPFGPEYSYQWSTGAISRDIFVTAAGTFSVTVTHANGCTSSASGGALSVGGGLSPDPAYCNNPSTGVCTGSPGVPCVGLPNPSFTYTNCNPIQFTNTTAGAVYTYWDFGDGGASWDMNPLYEYYTAGPYQVTMFTSDDGVCWSVVIQNVTINSVIRTYFEADIACNGMVTLNDLSYSAIANYTCQVDFGDNTPLANSCAAQHTYANPGIYDITFTLDDGICTKSYTKQVEIINTESDFTIEQICLGNHAAFTDISSGQGPVVDWDWDFGNGNTSVLKNPFNQYIAAGNYNVSLSITDFAGCTASSNQVVTIYDFNVGVITPNGPTTVCYGDSVELVAPAGAGYSYYWSTGDKSQSIFAKRTGKYVVRIRNADGCYDFTDEIEVTILPPLNAHISIYGQLTVCDYNWDIYQLAARPTGTGYSYEWTKDGSITSTNSYVYYGSSTSQSGDYIVKITDNNGCSDLSDPVTITVNPSPGYFNPITSGPTTFCEGNSVDLTAPSGFTYQWSNGDNSAISTVFASGNYTVTITNQYGCQSAGDIFVTVNPLPNLSQVAYGCYDLCLRDSIVIYALPGLASYDWSNGETTNSWILNSSGTYNLTATTSAGCVDSTEYLSIDISDSLIVNLGNDTVICNGSPINITPDSIYYSYLWSNGLTDALIQVNTPGIYYLTVEDDDGCEGMDSIIIAEDVYLTGTAIGDTICEGEDANLIASGGQYYAWSPASGLDCTTCPDPVASISNTSSYSVLVSSDVACNEDSLGVWVVVYPAPILTYDAQITVLPGDPVNLLVSGGTSYQWSPSTGLSCANCPNPTASVTEPTTYTIDVIDSNGCMSQATIEILLEIEEKEMCIDVATAFSPNNDGRNDLLMVRACETAIIDFKIFNRWGELVFESFNTDHGWDGKYKGRDQEMDVYVFLLDAVLPNGKKVFKKGNITLLR